MDALNDEERQVIETLHKVVEKCFRLTANLSEEEKAIVKRYNRLVTFFGNNLGYWRWLGIRLPKRLIERYHLQESLTLEEREDGILIKADTPQDKLSWEETFKEMAKEKEDWSNFEGVSADGID